MRAMRHAFVFLLIAVTLATGLTISFADSSPSADQTPAVRDPARDGDDRRGPRRDGPPPPPLTPEQIRDAVEVIRDISPWLGDRLEDARREDEERFVGMVTRMYPRFRRFMELRRHDPPLYALRIEEARHDSHSRRLSWQLVDAQRDGEPEKVERLKAELFEVLRKQYDAAERAHRHEIATLKARIAELDAQLAEHRARLDELIQERYDQLLAQTERMMERRRESRDGDRERERDRDQPTGDESSAEPAAEAG